MYFPGQIWTNMCIEYALYQLFKHTSDYIDATKTNCFILTSYCLLVCAVYVIHLLVAKYGLHVMS